MLNRRSLRVKVFKNLYSLEQCRLANSELARDRLVTRFSPDLNSMEAQPAEELAVKRNRALNLYNRGESDQDSPGTEIAEAVEAARQFEAQENARDVVRFEKALFDDVERIRSAQVQVFRLLVELAFQNKKIADERADNIRLMGDKRFSSTKLYDNPIVRRVAEYAEIRAQGKGVENIWAGKSDLLRDWYKGILGKDEAYKAYLVEEPDTARDLEMVEHILRDIVFKDEAIREFFEEWDINWGDNRPIVRSMVLKSLRRLGESGDLTLTGISFNWEEDADFTRRLYLRTVENGELLDSAIRKHLENWDLDRVALTDKVILKAALCEMMEFPAIPVKVTLNEFIEISKVYSTPKSKGFVNGLLDMISAHMIGNGQIRKSGRGLIDNK
jgi:transcription antitermination protein NusB